MVDDETIRTALKQEADTVALPDRVWAKVQTARPDRAGLFSRLHIKRAVEVLAVCAVLAAVVGVATMRANHLRQDAANQQGVTAALPEHLSVTEIKVATVKMGAASPKSAVELAPAYLAKIVEGYNSAPKQVRPRTTPATPDYTIDMQLTSGKMLTLGVLNGQPTMGDYDGARFWIESKILADVLRGADSLVGNKPDVPSTTAGPFLAPDKLANVTSVEWQGPSGIQKTTNAPDLIFGITNLLGKVTAAAEQNIPGENGEAGSIILHPTSGENVLVEYYCTSVGCYVRGSFGISGWHKAPGLDSAIKPLRPGAAITMDAVIDIARHTVDPTIEWVVHPEKKRSLDGSTRAVYVAVALNSQNQRVAVYVDQVTGDVLQTDAPEGMDKAEAVVKEFYSLTSHGEWQSVWDLLHGAAQHPNPSLTPEVIQARLAAKQGKPGPALTSATAGKMSLDYSKYYNCMCQVADSVYVTAKLSDGTEERIMVAREADGVWRILWAPGD